MQNSGATKFLLKKTYVSHVFKNKENKNLCVPPLPLCFLKKSDSLQPEFPQVPTTKKGYAAGVTFEKLSLVLMKLKVDVYF